MEVRSQVKLDNAFVERIRRGVKCEEVYLKGYDSVTVAQAAIVEQQSVKQHGKATCEP